MTRPQINHRLPRVRFPKCGCIGLAILAGLTGMASVGSAEPLGTELTYQGRITNGGVPVNDTLDFRFQLWDADIGGISSPPQFVEDVVVADGLFSVQLDFGSSPFAGDARWLAIGVRPGANMDPAPYAPLSPRQPVTAAPYAQTALNALSAEVVPGIDGHSLDAADGAPADAVFVDNAGNVGVGTTTPQYPLHVSGSDGYIATFETSDVEGTRLIISNTAPGGHPYRLTSTADSSPVGGGKFLISDGALVRLTLDASGNFGIGTATPANKLSVSGNADFMGGNVGIGTTTPANKLSVSGNADFTGNVGIGTTAPTSPLTFRNADERKITFFENSDPSSRFFGVDMATGGQVRHWTGTGGSFEIGHFNDADGAFIERMRVDGTADGGRMNLKDAAGVNRVNAQATANGGKVAVRDGTGSDRVNMWVNNNGAGVVQIFGPNGVINAEISHLGTNQNHGFIGVYGAGGVEKAAMFVNDLGQGQFNTDVLQLLGGADIAEPFDVHGDQTIEPGMVVSIDPENAGRVRLSTEAYDRTVAGVVSGAGGVRPAMTLQQKGTLADGAMPVALTGRVYVHVDADSGGSVRPGDLLTTSSTPGHAMKVTDYTRGQGAIIGKAMTALETGQGLVLVLVSLQ